MERKREGEGKKRKKRAGKRYEGKVREIEEGEGGKVREIEEGGKEREREREDFHGVRYSSPTYVIAR